MSVSNNRRRMLCTKGGAVIALLLMQTFECFSDVCSDIPTAKSDNHNLLSPNKAFNIATRQRISGGQEAAYVELRSSMEGGSQVTVSALGGSMMAGVDCVDGEYTGRSCSYSARFARSLRDQYSQSCKNSSLAGSCVQYFNHASGGTTTAGNLPQLPVLIST